MPVHFPPYGAQGLYGWTFGGPAGVRLGLERTVAIGVLHQAVVAPKVHLGVVRHVVVVLIVLAVDEAVTVRVAVELVSDEERDANRDGLSNLVHGHFLTQAAWDGSPAKCKSGVTAWEGDDGDYYGSFSGRPFAQPRSGCCATSS